MRYRLMASYLGASYQAAVGPSDRDVTLFAAPPPPEEHAFSPAPGGIWRKQVRLDDLDGLWESRPIGSYHGEPCLVLDDLGDRLHIVYLGMDERRAAQLGYWEVDRGVFEVVVLRHDVTDLAEERHEFPISLLLSALPRALGAGDSGGGAGVGVLPASIGAASPGSALSGPGAGARQSALNPAAGGGWNGQAAAQPAIRGQLPPAGTPQLPPGTLSQPAAALQQQPAAYQNPAPGLPAGAGMPQPAGTAGMLAAPQPPMGPQAPGMQQAAGMQRVPVMRQALGPAQNGPGGQPQTAAAAQAPVGAMQLPAAPPSTLQQGSAQAFTGAAPLPPASLPPAPLPAAPLPPVQQQAAPPLPADGEAQNSQQPAAAAAWHGSPAPDGNGTWYYQPAFDPQRGVVASGGFAGSGVVQNGYPQPQASMQNGYPQPQASTQNGYPQPQASTQNGYPQPQASTQNGYPQQAQDAAGNTLPGGQAAVPQYAPAGQPAGGVGYPQAAPLQMAAPQQAQQVPGLPAPGQPTLASQAMPMAQPPQVAQALPPVPLGQPAVQAATQTTFPPASVAAPGGAVAGSAGRPAGTGVSDSGGMTALGQPQAFGQQQAPATASPLAPQAAPPMPGTTMPAPSMPGAPQASPLGTVPQAAGAAPAVATAPDVSLPAPVGPAVSVPAPFAANASVAALAPVAAPAAPLPGSTTAPQTPLPSTGREQTSPIGAAAGALSKLTGAVRGRRAARKPRLAMSAIFADLVDMADIPRSAYAVDEEVTGAMCLFKTDGGYEVFSCAEDARHEVRFFEDEEAAYFYLFGVLAAEALRNGRLSPRRG